MPIIHKGLRPVAELNPETISNNSASFKIRTDIEKTPISEIKKACKTNQRVLLINPGPSSRNDSVDLRKQMDRTSQLNVLCGSAVSFIASGLVERSYVDAIVLSNPESAYETCFDEDTDLTDIRVFVAQQCKAEIFDKLLKTGATIIPFDAYIEGITPERDERNGIFDQIAIGYGAAVSAISLFGYFGYREFQAIGWDGTKEYAAGLEHLSIPDSDPNPFDNDVTEFGLLVNTNPQIIKSIFLHGDGPTAKLLNAEGNKPRTEFGAFQKIASALQPSTKFTV